MTHPAWLATLDEAGTHHISVMLGGRKYVAGFDVCEQAVQARLAAEMPTLASYAANFALWELPRGGWVRLHQLPAIHAQRLRELPDGYVQFRGDAVRRVDASPLEIRSLAAVRVSAPSALGAFGAAWWAPIEVAVASRGASSRTVAQARSLGLGLHAGGSWRSLPRFKRPSRPTPLLWWQAELTFAAWLKERDRATA